MFRRWDLLDRLAGDRDASAITERRHTFATLIRCRLAEPPPAFEARIAAVVQDLAALVSELENRDFELDPACAVACKRLLSDLTQSPLLNLAGTPEELRSRVRQIRDGFRPRSSSPSVIRASVRVGGEASTTNQSRALGIRSGTSTDGDRDA